ncbi:hypothetical protein KQX54_010474 [Cotesia glomerata]|uniref:Uncharacterized protein n=1 Tax=Cotesia glomerata TaxID=32391 RepID=A0AAV7J2I3_COTGL|nr:hypothetical protein KQX54_010474 [Cotesia glomerata]
MVDGIAGGSEGTASSEGSRCVPATTMRLGLRVPRADASIPAGESTLGPTNEIWLKLQPRAEEVELGW